VLIFYFFFHGAPREVKGRPAAAKVGAGQSGTLYVAYSKFLPKHMYPCVPVRTNCSSMYGRFDAL